MGDMADYYDTRGEGEFDDFEKEENDKYHSENKSKMKHRFNENKRAEIGCTINCAYCNRKIIKKTKDHSFCGKKFKKKGKSSCKDSFYNYTVPSRRR